MIDPVRDHHHLGDATVDIFEEELDFCPSSQLARGENESNGEEAMSTKMKQGQSNRIEDETARSAASEYKCALIRTAALTFFTLVLCLIVQFTYGSKQAIGFAAVYILELSLSVDNLFVFVLIFKYFKVPTEHQQRVLFYGIAGAVVMRGIMIGVGLAALNAQKWILLVLGLVLFFSSYKVAFGDEDEDEDLSNNFIIKWAKRLIPATDAFDGGKFFTLQEGRWLATPLLVCTVCLEISDALFAVDSVPACLGVSHNVAVVLTANLCAVAGLQSLFQILARGLADLPYLPPAVALILAFLGVKLVLEFFGADVGTGASLVVVALLLAAGVAASLAQERVRGWAAAARGALGLGAAAAAGGGGKEDRRRRGSSAEGVLEVAEETCDV